MIRVACSPGERRVAVTSDGRLIDYALDRPGAPDGVGDVHIGRVTARRPAMAGAFVALDGHADGFLPDSAGPVTEGEWVRVRISRAAQGGKGVRLSRESGLADGPLRLLARGPDAVARMAAAHDGPIEVDDVAVFADLRLLGDRLRLVSDAFGDATEQAVGALARPGAALPGGARMTVTPTPALVAIDVDLAGAVSGRGGKDATHAAANAALIPALARQIRLRNLGGAIVVDFAGLSPKRRATLGPALASAVAGDPVRTRFLGFSALGLAELLRDRIRPPLHEQLAGPHVAALAALRALAREIAAAPRTLPELVCAPDVADALARDEVARADLARRAGRTLMVRTDRTLPPLAWSLAP